MNIEYQKTGNHIPIPVDKLTNAVYEKLSEYDNLVNSLGMKPTQSPYKDQIIYTTDEGKLIQIPKYIQEQAVFKWNKKNGNTDQIPKQLNTYNANTHNTNTNNTNTHNKLEDNVIIKENNNIMIYIFLLVGALLIMLYLYNKK